MLGSKTGTAHRVLCTATLLFNGCIIYVCIFILFFLLFIHVFIKDVHLESCLLEEMPKFGGDLLEAFLLPVHLT